MTVPRRSGPDRPTIGFLLDDLLDGYQEQLFEGVVDAAAGSDVDLRCFLGGQLRPEDAGRTVYDLASREGLDAIVAATSVLGSFLPHALLQDRLVRLSPLPTVSVGLSLPGVPSLLVDNAAGVRDLVAHLVERHGRRRIAFIRGLAGNHEAELRYAAYLEALAAHGLAADPALVYQGRFDRASGVEAVGAFLDERRVALDAVIGANDHMALYAMRELQRRGLRVPDDVVVVGFDDIEDAAAARPPLTTIRQPTRELAHAAVAMALTQLRGEPIAPQTSLRPTLQVRRSCGCRPARADALPPPAMAGDEATLAALFAPLLPGEPAAARALAAALGALRDGAGARLLLEELERCFQDGRAAAAGAVAWQRALGAAFRAISPAPAWPAPPDLPALRAAHEAALELVAELSEHAQFSRRLAAGETHKVLQRMELLRSVEESHIEATVLRDLPALGLRSLYVCRYTDASCREATLVFHAPRSDLFSLDRDLGPFPAQRLVPGRLDRGRRSSLAVLHLTVQEEQIGFAVVEIVPGTPCEVYQGLSDQVAGALKVSALVKEVRRHATDLAEVVDERTRQLRATQRQLVDTAHQAGMAEVAVGVLHNVGNLLNSVQVCAEQIRGTAGAARVDGVARAGALLAEHGADLPGFFAGDPRGRLLPSYLTKLAEGLGADLARVQIEAGELLDKTRLIRDTIRALQDFARGGLDLALLEAVEVSALVDVSLKVQEANLLRLGVAVRRELPPLPAITTQRAKVVHVLVNLVKNAVEAMRDTPPGERVLTVTAAREPDAGAVTISLADTGEGIPAEHLHRIFSYGFTTKPDGHGFGLHTCANYMAQLGGAISVDSPGPGRGATFRVRCPIAPPQG